LIITIHIYIYIIYITISFNNKNNNSSDISLVKYNNVLISTVIFSMILQGEEKILTGNWKTLGNTGNFVIWIYADTTKICTIFLENLKSYLNKTLNRRTH